MWRKPPPAFPPHRGTAAVAADSPPPVWRLPQLRRVPRAELAAASAGEAARLLRAAQHAGGGPTFGRRVALWATRPPPAGGGSAMAPP